MNRHPLNVDDSMPTHVAGYTLEVGYSYEYSSILSPSHLRLVALNKGVPFPSSRPLRYLELGFGKGLSLNIHAAASPGEYWGVDANPSHVDFASDLARASGVDIRILGMSFADLLNYENLPVFDVIVTHGVWSWTSDETRKSIVELLKRHLAEGGLFYVSYNSLPGCAGTMSLQQMLLLHSKRRGQGRNNIAERLAEAIRFTKELRAAGAAYFVQTPSAAIRLDAMDAHNSAYLCHEYLNDNWRPLSFAETAGLLSEAGMHFVASADLADHYDDLTVAAKCLELLKTIDDPIVRESALDLMRNEQFRRDVFVKGGIRLNAAEQADEFRRLEFALLKAPENFPDTLEFGPATINLVAPLYKNITAALADNTFAGKTVEDLANASSMAGESLEAIIRSLLVMTRAALVHPLQSPRLAEMVAGPCARLNAKLFDCPDGVRALASPVLGCGLRMPRDWRSYFTSYWSGLNDPAAWATKAWEKRSENKASDIASEDRLLRGAQSLRDAIALHRRMPLMERLGIANSKLG
jgi:SAM-dependent methyltransferase